MVNTLACLLQLLHQASFQRTHSLQRNSVMTRKGSVSLLDFRSMHLGSNDATFYC